MDTKSNQAFNSTSESEVLPVKEHIKYNILFQVNQDCSKEKAY